MSAFDTFLPFTHVRAMSAIAERPEVICSVLASNLDRGGTLFAEKCHRRPELTYDH